MFFASHLGRDTSNEQDQTLISPHGLPTRELDSRCASVKEAVKFSKLNNLLGVILDASIALHAPALITTIKKSGLVLITHGSSNIQEDNVESQCSHGVDGTMVSGVLSLRHFINT